MSKVAKAKKKSVSAGIAYINASFNNTTVTITDPRGDTLCWASGGTCGFKGSRKGTPFAGQCAAQQAAEKAAKYGVKELEVRRSAGRAAAARAPLPRCTAAGMNVKSIEDITPLPHNGCRPPKKRRV
jgi:small subunit ribosomal protein S11